MGVYAQAYMVHGYENAAPRRLRIAERRCHRRRIVLLTGSLGMLECDSFRLLVYPNVLRTKQIWRLVNIAARSHLGT